MKMPRWVVLLVASASLSCGDDSVGPSNSLPPAEHAAWRVPEDFRTFAEALVEAADGDTILLAPGVYSDTSTFGLELEVQNKSLAIVGRGGADSCTIQNGHLAVSNGGLGTFFVRGLSFRGGSSRETGLVFTSSHARVESCRFVSCAGQDGGALTISGADAQIAACTFENNVVYDDYGGALLARDSRIEVEDCAFIGNQASERGGGVACLYSRARFLNCRFETNRAEWGGGGMWVYRSTLEIARSTFTDNVGGDAGSAVRLAESAGVLDHCTIAGNPGEGALFLEAGTAVELQWCIIRQNCVVDFGIDDAAVARLSDCAIDTTAIRGLRPECRGTMVYGDPRFCNYRGCGQTNDLRLATDSPCRLPDGRVMGAETDGCE